MNPLHKLFGAKVETVRELLGRCKVTDLHKPNGVHVLKQHDTVGTALKVMGEKMIISAPVLNVQQGQMDDVLGFVDIMSILASFLEEINMNEVHDQQLIQRMRYLEEKGGLFAEKQLKDLKYLGHDGDFLHQNHAKQGSLLELVLKCFIEPRTSTSLQGSSPSRRKGHTVHRVACFDSTGNLTCVISQTDIIRFLASHSGSLSSGVASRSLQDLGFLGKTLETVLPETPTIDALSLCAKKKISGMPVVNEHGLLLGSFSITDLRSINPEHFGALALPVAEFLAMEHHTEFTKFNREPVPQESKPSGGPAQQFVASRQQLGKEVGQQLMTAQPESSFTEVLDMLAKHRIHRVYVVQRDQPVGVVTCTDILSLALRV